MPEVRTFILVIDGRLPSLNEAVTADRSSAKYGAAFRRRSLNRVKGFVREQLEGVVFQHPVQMDYYWFEKDRSRDMDNISSYGRKVIQDALRAYKILRNDGWDCIRGFTDTFAVDAAYPRIVVKITEVKK